jgi:UDPglucose 6-dehydrogenase
MNIGFVGLGKLGLPCALAIDAVTEHSVKGYDPDNRIQEYLNKGEIPYREEGTSQLLNNHNISFTSLNEVIESSEIIFVPIQTPHDPLYDGVTRLPDTRVDFDYSYLVDGLKQISQVLDNLQEEKIVVVISTVLPGTIESQIKPILSKYAKLCYNPFFIAMGTTINDFLNPEFVLMGIDDVEAAKKLKLFYKTLHNKEVFECTLDEAELIKVSYNTFITMKICLANTVTEMSHKLNNINSDNVMDALKLANQRLISDKYLNGGMGDGGGCHPRDNIALSWLSQKVDLSYDWYENLMISREKHTEWLAELTIQKSIEKQMEIVILGKSFKKETNLINGSPAYLLKHLIEEKNHKTKIYDPFIDNTIEEFKEPKVFFIATNHDVFKDIHFPIDSVVIDPWRMISEQEKIELISIGVS